MALTDSTVPYEILIRFNDDGTPRGAHVQSRRVVTNDGEVLKDDILPAAPLDLAGFPTSAIMSNTARDALTQIGVLTAQASELTEALQTSREHADRLVRENEALVAEVSGLREELSEPHDAAVSMLRAAALAFSPNEVLPAEVEAEVMSRVYRAMEMARVQKRNGG